MKSSDNTKQQRRTMMTWAEHDAGFRRRQTKNDTKACRVVFPAHPIRKAATTELNRVLETR
jgi:hypothetical protein